MKEKGFRNWKMTFLHNDPQGAGNCFFFFGLYAIIFLSLFTTELTTKKNFWLIQKLQNILIKPMEFWMGSQVKHVPIKLNYLKCILTTKTQIFCCFYSKEIVMIFQPNISLSRKSFKIKKILSNCYSPFK